MEDSLFIFNIEEGFFVSNVVVKVSVIIFSKIVERKEDKFKIVDDIGNNKEELIDSLLIVYSISEFVLQLSLTFIKIKGVWEIELLIVLIK